MDKDVLVQEIIRAEYERRGKGHYHDGEYGTGKVLRLLSLASNGVHPTDLCQQLGVTMPRITIILNTLEKEGLARRVIDENDRRKIVVSLTEKGKKIAEEKKIKNEERVRKMVNDLGKEDIEAYLRVLKYMKK